MAGAVCRPRCGPDHRHVLRRSLRAQGDGDSSGEDLDSPMRGRSGSLYRFRTRRQTQQDPPNPVCRTSCASKGRRRGHPGTAAADGRRIFRRRTPDRWRRRRCHSNRVRRRSPPPAGHRCGTRCPGARHLPWTSAPGGHAGDLPQRRRRRVYAVVRTVRHRAPRSHGLRRPGGRLGRGRPQGHRSGRRHWPARSAFGPGATAAALARLLSDKGLREELGRAGQQRARARYSWDRVAAETEKAYLQTLTGNATARRLGAAGQVHAAEGAVL